jgi:hypothetical protein
VAGSADEPGAAVLFAAVIIGEHRSRRGSVDDSRIDIEPNPR